MSRKNPKLFVVNPGSTSTRVALFSGERAVFSEEIKHSRKELARFDGVIDQAHFRRDLVTKVLVAHDVDTATVDAFIGRGGLLRAVPGGVFRVNDRMLEDLRTCKYGEHASNLGAMIAHELARLAGKKAYVANPVVVDELADIARISGHPDFTRKSVFHALSQKAVAQKAPSKIGKPYEKLNLVIIHLGGGVTIGAHRKGKVVDVTNGLEGEGPFTPERTGEMALLPFAKHIIDNKLSYSDVSKLVSRNGGLLSHLGTNDCKIIEKKALEGVPRFRLVYDAFIYQVAKWIGAMATVLSGKVDAIIVTGGVARGPLFRRELTKRVRFIAPVHVILRNSEMAALALAGLDVLTGRKRARVY